MVRSDATMVEADPTMVQSDPTEVEADPTAERVLPPRSSPTGPWSRTTRPWSRPTRPRCRWPQKSLGTARNRLAPAPESSSSTRPILWTPPQISRRASPWSAPAPPACGGQQQLSDSGDRTRQSASPIGAVAPRRRVVSFPSGTPSPPVLRSTSEPPSAKTVSTNPRSVASSQTESLGQDVRHAVIVSW